MPLTIGSNPSSSTGNVLSLTSAISTDTGGRVFVPFTAASSSRAVGNAGTLSNHPFIMNTTDVNIGGVFSSSFRFTCPIAGIYHISMSGIVNGSGDNTPTNVTYVYGGPARNGVLYTFWIGHTNNSWASIHHTAIMKCAAGDLITQAINTSPSPVGPGGGMYADNHNNFTITFLG